MGKGVQTVMPNPRDEEYTKVIFQTDLARFGIDGGYTLASDEFTILLSCVYE